MYPEFMGIQLTQTIHCIAVLGQSAGVGRDFGVMTERQKSESIFSRWCCVFLSFMNKNITLKSLWTKTSPWNLLWTKTSPWKQPKLSELQSWVHQTNSPNLRETQQDTDGFGELRQVAGSPHKLFLASHPAYVSKVIYFHICGFHKWGYS